MYRENIKPDRVYYHNDSNELFIATEVAPNVWNFLNPYFEVITLYINPSDTSKNLFLIGEF